MTNWSERIPATIARGKEHLPEPNPGCLWPNEGELALAEALWMLHVQVFAMTASKTHDCAGNEYGPCQALVAFCEKMEGLSHD